MEESPLILKPIKEILNMHFFIPSYQRGYRWEERQVKDLLDDIYEFAIKSKSKDEFYCLQPIVVIKKDNEENTFKVIDGQQRLTTIYLILKYLKNSGEKFKKIKQDEKKEILEFCDIEDFEVKEPYKISYQTREKSNKGFLEEIEKQETTNKDNPDFYYMSIAYQTIKDWFKTKSKKQFLDTLLNDTKVIWYKAECKDEKEEIEIFSRLNIGKIPLTNAELIKAMLLLSIKDYKKQIEFSTIWDNIEQTLQKDEFWYFLTNKSKGDTAIDLIFDILAEKYFDENKKLFKEMNLKKNDDKFSYYVFDKILKENIKNEKQIWKETQEVFRYLLDWFNDREIYHKVGYLLKFNIKLVKLVEKYKDKTKSEFKEELKKLIKDDVKDIDLENLNYGDKKVHKVLLLFNIETILQNSESNIKFQFDKYKIKSWDIEHIASQTDNINKKEWVKAVLKYIYNDDLEEIKKIIGKDDLTKDVEKACIDDDDFIQKVKDDLGIEYISEELKDNIGNLTLLDSKTNRSYGNSFFPVKRAILLDNDSKGFFIPIATKNVFLKQYSKKIANMMNWIDQDVENYRNEISQKLEKYGVKNGK